MAAKSFIIPASQFTPAMASGLRDDCVRGLADRMGMVVDDSRLAIRNIVLATDCATSFPANQWWQTPALAVNTLAVLVNQLVPAAKAFAFFGCFNLTPIPTVVQLYLRQGAGGGTILQTMSLDALAALLETSGYFSTPVFYGPNDTIFIQVLGRAIVAGGELFGLHALVAEQVGGLVNKPT